MALTAEQEKFVVDLFTIYQKKQQVNVFAEQRVSAEEGLAVTYKVQEMNDARAALVNQYKTDTAQLNSEIETLQKNLTK